VAGGGGGRPPPARGGGARGGTGPEGGLLWDGAPATLAQIAEASGYTQIVGADGSYEPMYMDVALELWNLGLFLGDGESFQLDRPLTRQEGAVMALRALGMEGDALAAAGACPFADVEPWAEPYIAYAAEQGIVRGYSDTEFGALDAMEANQYITLMLRALGYDDAAGDFDWERAADLALELGVICEKCRNLYTRSNLFLRDHAAAVTYYAIKTTPRKAGGYILDNLEIPGRPQGPPPAATERGASLASTAKTANPSPIDTGAFLATPLRVSASDADAIASGAAPSGSVPCTVYLDIRLAYGSEMDFYALGDAFLAFCQETRLEDAAGNAYAFGGAADGNAQASGVSGGAELSAVNRASITFYLPTSAKPAAGGFALVWRGERRDVPVG